MRRIYTVLTLFFVVYFSYGQISYKYCYKDDLDNADFDRFEPITVRVNNIALHRSDGSGFFKLLGSDDEAVDESTTFLDYLEYVNHVFANFEEPETYENCGYSGDEFFSDFKIRIKNNILPISSDHYHDYMNSGWSPSSGWTGISVGQFNETGFYLQPLDDLISNSPNYPKGINTYFPHHGEFLDLALENIWDLDINHPEKPRIAMSHGPTQSNLERSSRTIVLNRFITYLYHKYRATVEHGQDWSVVRNWHINDARGGIAHELGHSFSLNHTNSNCKNNLMRQGWIHTDSTSNKKNFLTPAQIRKAHKSLTNTNLIQFVTEDSYYNVGLQITQPNVVFNKKTRLYSDIIIENGASLTLEKDLIMPPQSTIYIRNGGTLNLHGGIIISADEEGGWGGIYLSPNGNLNLNLNMNLEIIFYETTQIHNNQFNSSPCFHLFDQTFANKKVEM